MINPTWWNNTNVTSGPMRREDMQRSLDKMMETAAKESGLVPSIVREQNKRFAEMIMLTLFGPPTEEGDDERKE